MKIIAFFITILSMHYCCANDIYKDPKILCKNGVGKISLPEKLEVMIRNDQILKVKTETGETYVLSFHKFSGRTDKTSFFFSKKPCDHHRPMIFIGTEGLLKFRFLSELNKEMGKVCGCADPNCMAGIEMPVPENTFTTFIIESGATYHTSVIFEPKRLILTFVDYYNPENYLKIVYHQF